MSKEVCKVFDYSQVASDEKGKLIRLSGQLKRHGETMVLAGNEIRKIVTEAHSLLAHHRAGLFDEWIQTESEISLSTAYNCLNVEKRAPNFPILENCPPTVAYLLAAPKVPDKAIREFEASVKKGAKPTIEMAQATIKKFREATARSTSAKGKPGGASHAVAPPPASSGPASGEAAGSNGKDLGKCPNCAGGEWYQEDGAWRCCRCDHWHGEPTGGADEDRVGDQRSKTIKTCEALMRAFDDLNHLLAKPEHGEAIASCKFLLKTAKGWK